LQVQGRFEEARAFLERAYQMNTSNVEAATELEQLYDHILQETDDVEIRFALGKLNYNQNDFDKAIGHFQKTSQDFRYENESIKTHLSEKARRRYGLVEELARGAMGIVYKAKDNELEEMVALKILPDNLTQNPEAVGRFKSQARSARRLAHPNIVRIHDIGEE